MTQEKVLNTIKNLVNEKGEFDLRYDEQTESLFYQLELELNLSFSVYIRSTVDSGWLQAEYYSNKLAKTIIWNYDVGNFDDYEEIANFVATTENEIKAFEQSLPDLSPCARM